MTNDNDLLLLASSQNNGTYSVYIDSNGYKTLTPQTSNYTATYRDPNVYYGSSQSLLYKKNPKKVRFPNCSNAKGDDHYGAFCLALYRCTSITSVSFPVLTTATGGGDGGGYGTFFQAFWYCTSLTSLSFPSLTTIRSSTGVYATFREAFYKCPSSLKVHFKKSMKGNPALEYSLMGLTSADQVVFDLP